MSNARTRHVVSLFALLSLTAIPTRSPAQQGSDRYAELARQIVKTSAAVKPGEAVWVMGGTHTVPLMDAIGAEVTRTGAALQLSLSTERTTSAFFKELPEKYLRVSDSVSTAVYGDILESADVMIMLPQFTDPDTLFGGFASDSARYAKVMQTWAVSQQQFDAMRNNSRTRFVFVNYPPTRSDIVRSGMDSATFDRMILEAVTTDYDRVAATGRDIKRALESGKSVRITTPSGTDLRLTLAGRPAAVIGGAATPATGRTTSAAQRSVSLPGGTVTVAPLETSATGKVVIPRNRCFGKPLVNARFEFRNGKLTGFEADSGASCFKNTVAGSPSPADMFGALSIGINPALKPVESEMGYHPWEASGAVVITVGNNTDVGGKNSTPLTMPFWLSHATVEIDGKAVVRDGRLMNEVTSR